MTMTTQPTRPNLNELSKRISDINEANGWTVDLSNRVELGNKIALVASEACEVLDELEGWKGRVEAESVFTAMAVEYADAAIRILHLMPKLGMDPEAVYKATEPWQADQRHRDTLAGLLMQHLVRPSFKVFEALRDPVSIAELKPRIEPILGAMVHACEGMSKELSRPLWPIIDAKLEKNAKRGFHHGGKVF